MFDVNYFNNLLTQNGIDKFNKLFRGNQKEKVKEHGLNELINIHNQKAGKDHRIPSFGFLKKQILSDAEINGFVSDGC